ncbi:MAG: TraR/DksA family transcriptional regulator [Candidatus Omnitrophica bacterium]|nr:TraR/DksA family transcriptional regulator [Candidatus Omnitrophota bacterium]
MVQKSKKKGAGKIKSPIGKGQPAKKPSAPKLPKRELERYKKALLAEKAKIFGEFVHLKNDALNTSMKDAAGDLSGYSYHLADMASGVYETDFLLRLAADERERLYTIDEAPKRIEDGTFGVCVACAKPITKQRLAAIPQTEYCLKCQELEEHKP